MSTIQNNVTCNGGSNGSITVTASGGTGTKQYSNDNGFTYQSSNIFSGLTAGTYQVVVKDDNNCTKTSSVTITEPSLITFSCSNIDILCYNDSNGSITVTASGGTGTLQYSKNNGSTYQLSNIFSGLTANTYQIVVKDANNCITTVQDVTLTQPVSAISSSVIYTDYVCPLEATGEITVTASGGTGQLQYSDDNGNSFQTSSIFNNLSAGTYQIVVKDDNNCTVINSITINAAQPFQSEQICLVSVDSITSKNKIIWNKTPGVGTASFNVYKEVMTNVYSWLGNVPYSNQPEFVDNTSTPEVHNDKYKIAVYDTCNTESQKSFYHQTINLSISQGIPSSTIVLQWTPYVEESGVFVPSEYKIFRGPSPSTMNLYATVSGSVTSYNDLNVFDVYYYKVIIERNCGTMMLSGSNIQNNMNVLINNISAYDIIVVSPNPFSESTTIKFYNPDSKTFLLKLTDTKGRVVRKTENVTGNEIIIERKDLEAGVYFMELKGENRTYRGKLMIE